MTAGAIMDRGTLHYHRRRNVTAGFAVDGGTWHWFRLVVMGGVWQTRKVELCKAAECL
jgi:hypothetical protein